MNDEDIARLEYDVLAKDLMVGDRMRVASYDFCTSNRKLFVVANAGNQAFSEYSPNMILISLPNKKFAVQVTIKPEFSINRHIPTIFSCEGFRHTKELFPVSTVNDFTNLSDYVEALKKFKLSKE